MNFSVAQDLFARTLRRCTLGGGNSTNPVQSLVRLEALKSDEEGESDQLIFSANNGLIAIEIINACDCTEQGVSAIHCKSIAAAAAAMPTGDLAAKMVGKKFHLQGKPLRKWSCTTADPDVLKRVPEPTAAKWLRVPIVALKAAIDSVEHATRGVEEHQGHTDGIFFSAEGNELVAVVTTSHLCAARIQTGVALECDRPWKGLLPTRLFPFVRDAIVEAEFAKVPEIEFFLDDSYLWISGSSTLIACAVHQGEYPPAREVLKTYEGTKAICTLPRLAMIESLKALQATASADVTVRVQIQRGTLTLSGATEETDYSDEIEVAGLSRDVGALFGLKCDYLYSCMKACGEDPELVILETGYVFVRTATGYQQMICPRDLSKMGQQPTEGKAK